MLTRGRCMMRKKLGLLLGVAGLLLLPAGVAAAQDADPSPCFGEGDGSIIGEPSPCPEETIGGPTEQPESPGEAPPEEETPGEEATTPAPDQDDDDAVPAQPQAQQAGLADTGADAGVLAFVAVGALGLGALALVVSRWGRGDSQA